MATISIADDRQLTALGRRVAIYDRRIDWREASEFLALAKPEEFPMAMASFLEGVRNNVDGMPQYDSIERQIRLQVHVLNL